MSRICGGCAHYEHTVGCLHIGAGSRFCMAGHATTPACPYYEDALDPNTRACATCRFLLSDDAGRGECHAPDSTWPKRSDIRCKVWEQRG
ncbi:hypothetical protein [Pseudodesulfovibrio indicus]|uniref:Uncharacterized protein n=1 Tax=Pseudodesulfovibrio indicus TaxID=1716143 RepID=A0AA94PMG3_9BACT|nr:hypothetical protein [Pseudodesulfovibrio indicus]TDT86420.1 hypothetical protein EDC59_11396 [Pseudodesulfovibrio indicus]